MKYAHSVAVLLATVVLITTVHAAPIVTIDPIATNTLIFRDYNGSSDSNVSYNPVPAPTQDVANGVSTWTYGGIAADPKIMYNDGAGAWNHATYPWTRIRFEQSRPGGGAAQYWEQPARGGEGVALGTAAALKEVVGNAANPTPSGSGFRIDPVVDTQTGDVFTVDYVMVDTYQTLGFAEWDAVSDQQGWNTANVTNALVTNSTIGGTASTGDPQVYSGAGQFDADAYRIAEIRMRASAGAAQLFWAQGGGYTGTQAVGLGLNDGTWHTYLLDFSRESTWTGADIRLRLDPSNVDGATFEIDYVRLRAAAYGIDDSPRVRNPSFEAQSHAWPGTGDITAWEASGTHGINPATSGADPIPFANNGLIPDQSQVAYMQGPGTLRQTISGFDTNATYWLQLWFNSRASFSTPNLRITCGEDELLPPTAVPPVEAAGQHARPYAFTNLTYVPTTESATLVLENAPATGDRALLLDAICIVRTESPFDIVIRNPGFEASGKPPGNGHSSPIAGWEGTNAGINDTSQPFYDNGQNPEGEHVVFIQNSTNETRSLQQELANLEAGRQYVLSYAYNVRAWNGGPIALTVSVGATQLFDGSVTSVTTPGDYSVPFHAASHTFTAPASSAVLRFETPAAPDDRTILLDDIHLRALSDSGTLFILR